MYWTSKVDSPGVLTRSEEIMSSIFPKGMQDDIPNSFSVVGHVGRHPTSIGTPRWKRDA